ncbi:hypothetical protein ACFVTM_07455 [Arthrobacter sp. NPDC058130]|uniref:hypothetical protein n=1 Tax=Arthrobacter sp. NPDC058130 TaxID=3346353 RepID=UPI0036E946CB
MPFRTDVTVSSYADSLTVAFGHLTARSAVAPLPASGTSTRTADGLPGSLHGPSSMSGWCGAA